MSENQLEIDQALQARAAWHADQTHLVVDYYRIRRKVAYPLPVTGCDGPGMVTSLSSRYPWGIWLSWSLEERVHALGWSAQLFEHAQHAQLAQYDLIALCDWPRFTEWYSPDLIFGHMMRLLATAQRQWHWLDDENRQRIVATLTRAVDEHRAWSDEHYGEYDTRLDPARIDARNPPRAMHNIPLIGAIGLAIAATTASHADAPRLVHRAAHAALGFLDHRTGGHAEAVAYDGYVMDFIASLLEHFDAEARQAVLEHPQTRTLLDQSLFMAAPGHAMRVARIGDVEPREMPFHATAHARLSLIRPGARSHWYLNRCPLPWLRTDALVAMRHLDLAAEERPEAGALDAHYATVLRSGWDASDVAVAISSSRSMMGHLPPDAGTLVIGTQGRWLIDDPGYQQYLPTAERRFTLGPTAHNAPVINGFAPTLPGEGRCIERCALGGDQWRATIDMAGAYDRAIHLEQAHRTVWLIGRRLVVVADALRGEAIGEVRYHWHGEPDAAWTVNAGHALVHLPPATLWITCPHQSLGAWQIDRLRGSRGHLTLTTTLDARGAAEVVYWWTFTLDQQPASVGDVDERGHTLRVDGQVFELRDAQR